MQYKQFKYIPAAVYIMSISVNDYIIIDPRFCHGKPIFKGTRIMVSQVLELLEAGKVVPVIDRRYHLREAAEALRYLGAGHAQGKVVITVEHNNK